MDALRTLVYVIVGLAVAYPLCDLLFGDFFGGPVGPISDQGDVNWSWVRRFARLVTAAPTRAVS